MKELGLMGTIANSTYEILFTEALNGSDNFRIWFYHKMPESYEINPRIPDMIYQGIVKGKSAKQISKDIIEFGSNPENP